MVVILAALACVLVLRAHDRSAGSTGLSSYQVVQKKWYAAFDRDPQKAYADFLKEGNNVSYDEAHKLSHIVGEIIYAKFGVDGIARCSSDFGYGCYHGVAGAALNSKGLSAVANMSTACKNAGNSSVAFGCIHGIGHGILSYLGNDSLAQTLEACEPINAGAAVGGCYGGAFMEYNFNTMQSTNGIELRPLQESQVYEPCATEIPEKFKEACYYDQASWWHASFGNDNSSVQEKYAKVGKLCAGIADVAFRSVCFRGIGNVIGPESGYKATVMKQWCKTMPDESSFDGCYHEALQHLLQSEEGKAQLLLLCDSKAISYTNICSHRWPCR